MVTTRSGRNGAAEPQKSAQRDTTTTDHQQDLLQRLPHHAHTDTDDSDDSSLYEGEPDDDHADGASDSDETDDESADDASDSDESVDSAQGDTETLRPAAGDGDDDDDDDDDSRAAASAATALATTPAAAAGGAAAASASESESDDEAPINTIGNVPLEWYDGLDHVGYDLEGRKILRGAKQDELDALIKRYDDPDAARTVHDALHGVDVVLKEEDIALIRQLQRRRYPDPKLDPYPAQYISEYADKLHPLSNAPPRKAPFLPSKGEAKQVMRLVMAMRSEQYAKSVENRRRLEEKRRPNYQYLIWDEPAQDTPKHHRRLPPPKVALPGNAESYNPPPEYLFTPEEREAWERMDPSDRPLNFVPQSYTSMRRIPLYEPLIKERFERCLDLYLCPRVEKEKLQIDPDSLIPTPPSPAELRPFPERLSGKWLGHVGRVYSVSVSPSGEWLLSGGADGTVRLWEVASGRQEASWQLSGEVRCVAWNPNVGLAMAAAVVEQRLVLLLPLAKIGGPAAERAAELLEPRAEASSAAATEGDKSGIAWSRPADDALREAGVVWEVAHSRLATKVAWHRKGDYLVSVAPQGASRAVLLHQVSKHMSGSPFSKSKGSVEDACFHPSKPLLLVATQRHVRIYDLATRQLEKKLNPSAKWISSIDVHPGGDNLLLGSYDKRLCWFDLDLSTAPYKTLRSHKLAVRSVAYHKKLPLFASASDDGSVHVYHGRVFADLLTNALIVPLKMLKGHSIVDHIGVLDIAFHPTQPWIFSCGADGAIHLYCS